jgi:hypothetical protein
MKDSGQNGAIKSTRFSRPAAEYQDPEAITRVGRVINWFGGLIFQLAR